MRGRYQSIKFSTSEAAIKRLRAAGLLDEKSLRGLRQARRMGFANWPQRCNMEDCDNTAVGVQSYPNGDHVPVCDDCVIGGSFK